MAGHTQTQRTITPGILWLMLSSLLLAACGGASPAKTYTIGVVNYVSNLEQVFAGFKAKMAASGYEEGRNVTYLYHGVLAPDPQVIAQEVQRLMTQKVDLFLTLGTPTTIAAKKAVTGTPIPVVFAPVVTPVKEGVVESITRPGGTVTGVQNGDTIPKALEWLHRLVPHATRDAAARLGVALRLDAVQTPEEALAAIETLPKDASILFIPAPGLESHKSAMRQRALARGIPTGAYALFGEDVLFTYGPDRQAQGKQAARLVHQILHGGKTSRTPGRERRAVLADQSADCHSARARHPGGVPAPGRYDRALTASPASLLSDGRLHAKCSGLGDAERQVP